MRGCKRIFALLLVMIMASAVSTLKVQATAPEQTPQNEEGMTEEEKAALQKQKELDALYNLSVQTNEVKNWAKGPGTYGEAAIVMDADSGAVLYAKNIDKTECPASITKVLTALVAYEYGDMSGTVTITPHSLECLGDGYASIGMKEGNVISMEDAMRAMLMASSNEVACAIGEAVAVSQGQDYNWFLEKMNETVRELGGTNSNFANTNGVHAQEHYTCALDMALIGRALFAYPDFFAVCQTQQYTIPASETTEEHVFQQKHHMLMPAEQEYNPNVIGGKTGYTTEAGNTLITMADNGERRLICVVLKTAAGHVYSDTQALLDYGFGSGFAKLQVAEYEEGEEFKSIPEDAYVMVPEGVKFDSLKKDIAVKEEDTKEAVVTYYYKDIQVGSADVEIDKNLLNHKDMEFSESKEKKNSDASKDFPLSKMLVVVGIVIVIILAAMVLIRYRIACRRKRQRRRGRLRQRREQDMRSRRR